MNDLPEPDKLERMAMLDTRLLTKSFECRNRGTSFTGYTIGKLLLKCFFGTAWLAQQNIRRGDLNIACLAKLMDTLGWGAPTHKEFIIVRMSRERASLEKYHDPWKGSSAEKILEHVVL